MTNTNKFSLSKIVSVATVGVFCLGVLSGFTSLNVHAQKIGIEPFGRDKSNPKERGWFLYNVKAGETVEDFATISNGGDSEAKVIVKANDMAISNTGEFGLTANEYKNKELGSWIELPQGEIYTIPGKNAVKVPFKIKVPGDAKAGEYGGGLSIMQIDKEEEQKALGGGQLGTKVRMGARMYLTVKGDLKMSSKVDNLSIVSPKTQNFKDILFKRRFITTENMVVTFDTSSISNIHSVLDSKFEISLPGGQKKEIPFTRGLIPNAPSKTEFIQTGLPYAVGETKVKLIYKTQPLNDNKENLKTENTDGTLEASLTISQADLDEFKKIRGDLNKQNEDTFGKTDQNKNNTQLIKEEKKEDKVEVPQTGGKEENKDNNILLYGMGGAIVVLLLVILFVVFKKKKQEEKTETAVKSSEKAESSKKDEEKKETK